MLLDAARIARPDVLIFVIPDRLAPNRYARERAVFEQVVRDGFGVWVLEIAELRAIGLDTAVARARKNVFTFDGQSGLRLLLADGEGAP